MQDQITFFQPYTRDGANLINRGNIQTRKIGSLTPRSHKFKPKNTSINHATNSQGNHKFPLTSKHANVPRNNIIQQSQTNKAEDDFAEGTI